MGLRLATLAALTLALCAPLCAEGAEVKATGYLRGFLTTTDYGAYTDWEALMRLRLRLNINTSEALSWEFAYEAVPYIRGGAEEPEEFSPQPLGYRAYDIGENLYLGDRFGVYENLDRAFLTIRGRSVDLYIGRQAVAMGSARVINPTDVIAPYSYTALAKEERMGVDALRLRTPLGEMGEIDMALLFGEDFSAKKSAAFLRARVYVLKTDLTLIVMRFRENTLLGLDMARALGGASAWLEAAHVLDGAGAGGDYLRASAGADYSFTENLYAYVEYHYNGAGSRRTEVYPALLEETAYTEGGVYLGGRHYLAPGLSYQLTPLLGATLNAMINLRDGSALVSPGLRYSMAEDVSLEVGGHFGLGEESPDLDAPESEFGLYPALYYASVSMYF